MASSKSGVIKVGNEPLVAAGELEITLAVDDDAEAMLAVIHAAFGARGAVSPPPPALRETLDSVKSGLARGAAVIARVGERPAGVIFVLPVGEEGAARLQRVSVHPDFQGHGVAAAMIGSVHALAADLGYRSTELSVRLEFPRLRGWWERHGYRAVGLAWGDSQDPTGATLSRLLPTRVEVPTAPAMRALGAGLAGLLRAGDVLILNGDLGAGKTTLTQGIGAGLGVRGPIISPTFVLSREHPGRLTGSKVVGPGLVHVDAYRLSYEAELSDLDLESELEARVTVVEWGQGLAEHLSDNRLEIDIDRSDQRRDVWIQPIGPRWDDVDLGFLAGGSR